MRLPRFRIRTLMIAVAVAGVGLGVSLEGRRRYHVLKQRQILKVHEEAIVWLTGLAEKARQSEARGEPVAGPRSWASQAALYERIVDDQREWASYRRRMIRWYGGDPDNQ